MIETLTEEIRNLEKAIEERAGSLKETQLLMTLPGVSYFTALTVYAELGEIDTLLTGVKRHKLPVKSLPDRTAVAGERERMKRGPAREGRWLMV
ncbi:transposase [Halalkaliarchaeum desulfuricum]|uniref:Transposase n=1 Tax=Halalkaliarchaeum desulfuricum TaxID=2055893 RepID=A0A343TJP0_9EURY|nr:transposase [Halalkaliarchaeum desulfuricum]